MAPCKRLGCQRVSNAGLLSDNPLALQNLFVNDVPWEEIPWPPALASDQFNN